MKPLARFFVAALLMNSAACISVKTPRFMLPAPERRWQPTLERAQALAAAGQPSQADSVLADYAVSYPGTPGAREANYWRSLFQFQGAPVSSMTPSVMLSKYLASGNVDHRTEAAALLLATVRVDSLARAANVLTSKVQISNGEVANATARAADAKADTKDQDAEIKRLKAELAASKEELERIKKRLAEPPKKPPVK